MRSDCAPPAAIAQGVTVYPARGPAETQSVTTHHLIAVLCALLPAVVALWLGRGLDGAADADALSQRVAANRVRNSGVAAFCVTLICAATTGDWAWALPLLFLTRMSAGYVIRKRLYQDT